MKSYKVIGTVRHNGETYSANDTIDLTDKEATRLQGFGAIEADGVESEKVPQSGGAPQETDREEYLKSMTVDELKDYAKQNDIDLGGATKKDDIVTEILLAD